MKMSDNKLTGKIIKGIGGFYYVDAASALYECRARGVFRKQGITPLVGDIVDIEPTAEEGVAFLTDIHERKSQMIRPAVANVDQVVLIFSCASPNPNPGLIDRFLINMQLQDMETVIVISKSDLVTVQELVSLSDIYSRAGYEVITISNKTGAGIDAVRKLLSDKMTVLSGPSGVGKSSLINSLIPDSEIETGDISRKIGRGKNTTRHSEVFNIDETSYIIDTPGYSSIEVMCRDEGEVAPLMREFAPHLGSCRFTGCAHISEPDCAIKEAVEKGEISRVRYDSYVEIYESIKKRRKW